MQRQSIVLKLILTIAAFALSSGSLQAQLANSVSFSEDFRLYRTSWLQDYMYIGQVPPNIKIVDTEVLGEMAFVGDNWAWHFTANTWLYLDGSTFPWVWADGLGWLYFNRVLSNGAELSFYQWDASQYISVDRSSSLPYPLAGDSTAAIGLRHAYITAIPSGLYNSVYGFDQTFDFDIDIARARTIGEVTALIPEASTSTDHPEFQVSGQSGDTDFPFLSNMKVLATVGEIDPTTGYPLTGYPDGHAAWLIDEDTIRVAYQSESYSRMSYETYPWVMESGATFTGSHLHYIDYDRALFAEFLNNGEAASTMVEGSGHLFHTIYNEVGDVVVPLADGGRWGNQADGEGNHIPFAARLTDADFFFQSFCGAYLEMPNKYGEGIGFADAVYMMSEEWEIQSMFGDTFDTLNTRGLASFAVDVANGVAYTAPALGQTGYEKLLPINPMHSDYVVIVNAGYNYEYDKPIRVYIGVKGLGADGQPLPQDAPERDQFLARNGLLYGQEYGMAVETTVLTSDLGIETPSQSDRMFDAYMQNSEAARTFNCKFFPTSYRWQGWDSTPVVADTAVFRWIQESPSDADYMFFTAHKKTEHPAVDPDPTKARFIQNATNPGGQIMVDFTATLMQELTAANGDLPTSISAVVTRMVGGWDGALTLDVGGKGVKHGGQGDHSVWRDGRAVSVQPDGGMWIKTADHDIMIVDEDSGNSFGERKYALVFDPETLELDRPETGYFLAMVGGSQNPRYQAGTSVYGDDFNASSGAGSSEFSGCWNVSALIAKKQDNSFYTMAELAGTGEQAINASIPTNETTLIGVLQHRGESAGQPRAFRCDAGGQILIFGLDFPTAQ